LELVNCRECGKKISNEVSLCPHCGKYPFGVYCNLCGKFGKASEFYRGGYNWGKSEGVHQSCLKAHTDKNEDMRMFSCGACHRSYVYSQMNIPKKKTKRGLIHNSSCPYCGQPFYFYECVICGQPIVKFRERYPIFIYHHKSCMSVKSRLRNTEFYCIDCGGRHWYPNIHSIPKRKKKEGPIHSSSCRCGQPFYFYECTKCGQPVIDFGERESLHEHIICKRSDRVRVEKNEKNIKFIFFQGLLMLGVLFGGVIGSISCLNNFTSDDLITDFNLFSGALYGGLIGAAIGLISDIISYLRNK
jgi:hypothetical protein